MTEEEIEREKMEWIFGEELHEPGERWKDEWDGVFAYWYEGAPDYAPEYNRDFDREYRTAILNEVYGIAETPEGWERLASWSSSGERECPYQGQEELQGATQCYLCEEPVGLDGQHPNEGWLYIGEGWGEVLYRRLPVHLLKSEGGSSACGEEGLMNSDINFVTCPECDAIHEKWEREQEEQELEDSDE